MGNNPTVTLYICANGYIVDLVINQSYEETTPIMGMSYIKPAERRTFVASTIEEALVIIKDQVTGLVVSNVWKES